MSDLSIDDPHLASSRDLLVAFLVGMVPLALLAWRFNFVYDDAYISFRYTRHFVDGAGLRYNLGDHTPVEGYTNFLWVLCLAPLQWIGASLETWSRALSFLCASVLLWKVLAYTRREHGLNALQAIGLALVFGTLAPLPVWATSGLETMPFALALFLTYERLAFANEPPRWGQAGCAGLATALLRADGAVFVGLVLAAVFAHGLARRRPQVMRAAVQTGVLVAVGTAAHIAWRFSYYGALVPNTAATKVSVSSFTLGQGLDYVMEVLLTFPSILAALVAGFVIVSIDRSRVGGRTLAIAVAALAYVVFVGGDFMAMGRFVVPALPFVCVLAGMQIARFGRSGPVWALVLVGLSLPGAFDVHVVPESIRGRFRLPRFNAENSTQYRLWLTQKENTEEKVALGKALGRYTEPGESIVRAAIGAVGYYSDLFVYDQFGLVTPAVGTRDVPVERLRNNPRPPGHHKYVPPEHFVDFKPTYYSASLETCLETPNDRVANPSGKLKVLYEFHRLDPELVYGERNHLRLSRPVPPGWRRRDGRTNSDDASADGADEDASDQ